MTSGSPPPTNRSLDAAPVRSPDWTQYLDVDADLAIEVDTAAGERASGRLTGKGHRLRLEFDRPEILAGTADRSAVTAVAAQLAKAHLRGELHGPRGRIAVVDPAHTSRIAALITGSPHVTIDRQGWVLAARRLGPARVAATAGGVAAAVGLTALLAAAAIVRRRRSWRGEA